MVDHQEIQLALRSDLSSIVYADTGTVSLASSGSTFTRSSGSFLVDGFRVGMEIASSGFTDDVSATVVTQVSALSMAVEDALGTDGESGGRRLYAGLPSGMAWENVEFDPVPGRPHFVEQYLPGPIEQLSFGAGVDSYLESEPSWVVRVSVREGVGVGAINAYADAIVNRFYPGRALSLPGGGIVRVRGDTSPFRGQILHVEAGWATVSVTVPLRTHPRIQ